MKLKRRIKTMKKNYKLYKLQPFNHDYKIVDISKKEYEKTLKK